MKRYAQIYLQLSNLQYDEIPLKPCENVRKNKLVLNLGPNGKVGVKKPKRRSTLLVLHPPPKLDLLDGEKLGCNGKTSAIPVAMGAPSPLPLSGL